MSIFDAYDQEFRSLCQDISKNVGELKACSPGDDRSSGLIRMIEGLVSQATDLIKQMEVEVRSHDAATRKVLGDKVSEYKKSLASYRSDFERAKEQSQRSALIGDKSSAQRQRLLDANDKYVPILK
jgi:vesicle transport through interaction with t-SNAREs protein 1